MTQTTPWWHHGVIYQVYPRSFKDSNADGVGDLTGITQKLDYLQWLGVEALWLSPIYPSPMADFGYDISNYTDIDPIFGTLADFDTLIQQAHSRNLKVVVDYVPNHTSDEHPWFQVARASRTNEKRDWYIWRDPAPDGGPPNNWVSYFGGTAWQFDGQTGQYYLHLFDVKQPDLNWRNPAVREAMYDVLRFWLDRGVDGFRVDVLWMLIKDEQFRDNVMNPDWTLNDPPHLRQFATYTEDQPGMHDIVRDIRTLIDSYFQYPQADRESASEEKYTDKALEGQVKKYSGERVFIGELYLPLHLLVQYYGEELDEAHLPFNFQLVTMPDWNASAIRKIVDDYEHALPAGAWPNWVLGNHDRPRIATRVGRAQSRVAQMLLLTLRGTPTCYYGDELGMEDSFVPPELMHDPQGKDNPVHSRDPIRTPMQWDSSANAGFSPSGVSPWLPVAADYQVYNVAAEQNDPRSFLALVRGLLELRRASSILTVGSYQFLDQDNTACFAYQRGQDGVHYVVVLNISSQEQVVKLPQLGHGRIVLSTYMDREGNIDLGEVHLRGDEGYVIAL
ncbi:MAG TPA: alpha-amylase family glycosyl hydrolase [Ktedonobacteraceae bacterium]